MSQEPLNAEQELGQRVRAARTAKGLSLERMAAESDGLDWSYLGNLERNGKNVTLKSLLRIADVLDIDPAELVRGLKPDEV